MFLGISELITVPFGKLLEILYQWTSDYGVALILYSLVINLVLLPSKMKAKKGTMGMARLAPVVQELQKKYGKDTQKAQQATMKLYQDAGVNPTSGCLWSILPLLLLFPLFQVIREPMVYLMHLTAEETAQVVDVVKGLIPDAFTNNSFYDQLITAPYVQQFAQQIKEALPNLDVAALPAMNFNFLGVNLGQVPSYKLWAWEAYDWNHFGLFLLPLLSCGLNALSVKIGQAMNNTVIVDENGQRDAKAAKTAEQQAGTGTMMLMMPIMTLIFGFLYPGALSVYFLAQGALGIAIDAALTVYYRKDYDNEDAQRRARAALAAAEEEERERLRAQRRAENPDGIVENTSKKKRQQQQRKEAEEAARAYAQRRAAERGEALPDKSDCPSGDPNRPYAKGRNYKPDRYRTSSAKGTDEE